MKFSRGSVVTLLVLLGVVLVVGVLTFLTIYNKEQPPTEATRVLESTNGNTTPFTDLEGKPFSMGQYDGKVRVVSMWASWCPSCAQELADFAKLATKFSQDEVAVIAINRGEPPSQAKAFINILGDVTGVQFVLDPNDVFHERVGGFSMPETVFYDKNGNVVFHKRGAMTFNEMKKYTETALIETNE